MSTRKRPLDHGSDDQSDFGNKRQKVTHNGTNNNNNKEVVLDLNNDIQKKVISVTNFVEDFQELQYFITSQNCHLLAINMHYYVLNTLNKLIINTWLHDPDRGKSLGRATKKGRKTCTRKKRYVTIAIFSGQASPIATTSATSA